MHFDLSVISIDQHILLRYRKGKKTVGKEEKEGRGWVEAGWGRGGGDREREGAECERENKRDRDRY